MRLSHNLLLPLAILGLLATAASSRAATYYVATNSGASNSNPGTQASPWRTIAYAASKAVAGDTVMIKAGNYGNEYVVVANSGTGESKRITLEGYGGTVQLGTLPNPRTLPPETEIGISIKNKKYITLKNLNLTWYFDCIKVENSEYVTCDNIYVDKCGSQKWLGHGIIYLSTKYSKILNCTVLDAGGNNVDLGRCSYCLIDNLKTLGTLKETNTFATDYYCVLWCCNDCVVQNSYAEDTLASWKGNHGFIIKDLNNTPHSQNNKIVDCTAISFEECFSVAHLAHDNEFIRCVADNTRVPNTIAAALNCRNGAYNNTFRDCIAKGRIFTVGLGSYSEGNAVNKAGNKFINCTISSNGEAGSAAVFFWQTSNTVFENCVFDKANYFGRYIGTNTGISLKNCIFTGMNKSYDTRVDSYYPLGNGIKPYDGTSSLNVTYSDFWGNGFSVFSGTGNMSVDPKFANQAGGDYHLKSKAGRWNGSGWVNDTEDSPLIDKGDPASIWTSEPAPNGGRINIGIYGNRAEASKSSSGTGEVASAFDNRLAERYPTTVYPSNVFLDVGHLASTTDKKYRGLIWFDLSPYSGLIKKATLSLYWYYPSTTRANSTIVDIYRPAIGWNHHSVSWTNKTDGIAWANPGGDWYDKNGMTQGSIPYASFTFSASQSSTNQFYAFDVTALVNEYLKSGQNAGFLVKARTENDNYIGFYGLAASDSNTRPKLDLIPANPVPAYLWILYS